MTPGRGLRKFAAHLKGKSVSFWELLYVGETGFKPLDWVSDKCNSIISEFRSKKEMIERMIFWGWKMRNSWDFDASTTYSMIHLKLDRCYKTFKDHGHCAWNSSEKLNRMRKLKEASKLAERLYEDKYDIRAFKETDERFKFKQWFTPSKYGSQWHSTYEKTPKRARIFYKARGKVYLAQKKYEHKRLFELLDKYLDQWWD